MSVFDGEIEYRSMYMVDFVKKDKPKSPRRKAIDDDCLIVGISRDSLKARDQPRKSPDVLCPIDFEFYKKAVQRFADDHPKLTQKYMTKDVDPIPIDHEIQDTIRHLQLPFMSVNLTRRARALQTLRLPDDIYIPDTSQKGSYRHPKPEKYADPPSSLSMKPKFDPSLQKELRRILRVRTGDTSYGVAHGLLAQVVLERNPFGPAREEPKYGRWKNPYGYTYRI
ncbi:hypothetical protein KGM_207401 [Danaus plexippus plexippus]|uniref:Uncharacterized protein n=1 Tax=Danaus plexippus plexippus TaxID=278856 RepID=A0A212FPE3_DANPL|nr:hypothetical protein KGM_207401 [Danaus plexippus plexippus]